MSEVYEVYTQILDDNNEDAGIHREQLSNAVQCWSWMQQRSTSVAEAALTFNTTPELIRQAVSDNRWLCSIGVSDDPEKQMIEHDGE